MMEFVIMMCMIIIMFVGIFMYILPSKCVKKEDRSNIDKMKKAKRNGILIAILGAVAIFIFSK